MGIHIVLHCTSFMLGIHIVFAFINTLNHFESILIRFDSFLLILNAFKINLHPHPALQPIGIKLNQIRKLVMFPGIWDSDNLAICHSEDLSFGELMV